MLNLNNPKDAREDVLIWMNERPVAEDDPIEILDYTDDDCLMIAKQLFLYADRRKPLGFGPH